jgi:hypothetical protein
LGADLGIVQEHSFVCEVNPNPMKKYNFRKKILNFAVVLEEILNPGTTDF